MAHTSSQLKVGDEVRVIGASEWRDEQGTVVEIFERHHGSERAQECAVRLEHQIRSFTAAHLVRVVPCELLRFFRSEIAARWPLNSELLDDMDGSAEQLVVLLRVQLDFSIRRAQAEVDEFLTAFDEKIHRARTTSITPPV
jgi:hypothetical protein